MGTANGAEPGRFDEAAGSWSPTLGTDACAGTGAGLVPMEAEVSGSVGLLPGVPPGESPEVLISSESSKKVVLPTFVQEEGELSPVGVVGPEDEMVATCSLKS